MYTKNKYLLKKFLEPVLPKHNVSYVKTYWKIVKWKYDNHSTKKEMN